MADFGYTEGYKKTSATKKKVQNLTFLQSLLKILKVKIILITV